MTLLLNSLSSEIIRKAVKLTEETTDTEMMWFYLDKIPGIKKTTLPEGKKKKILIKTQSCKDLIINY